MLGILISTRHVHHFPRSKKPISCATLADQWMYSTLSSSQKMAAMSQETEVIWIEFKKVWQNVEGTPHQELRPAPNLPRDVSHSPKVYTGCARYPNLSETWNSKNPLIHTTAGGFSRPISEIMILSPASPDCCFYLLSRKPSAFDIVCRYR